MKKLMKDAGMSDQKLYTVEDKVYQSCNICTSTGRPAITKNISLTHVNDEFSQEVQADFVSVRICNTIHEVLNVMDLGTSYGERRITSSINAHIMKDRLEEIWFCHHGAPNALSADPKFCHPFFEKYLSGIATRMKKRSA